VALSELEVLRRFREAYSKPWGGSTIRYVDDGRPFWRFIVAHATGSHDQRLFEDIYEYYARGEAWSVSPGACDSLQRIRQMGFRTAVVSNFDSRLRRIMADLDIDRLFDCVVVSAEVGAEKPNPLVFERACEALGVAPEQVGAPPPVRR
jgi:FMN phosphatase YigB (HAD superfamily)